MRGIDKRRVLIVEDNALIGHHIAAIIEDAGGVPLGPICTNQEAQDALDDPTLDFDAAVLDLHLDGASILVAERLRAKAVPFVFATGNRSEIPAGYEAHPVCEKPFTPLGLLAALRRAFEDEADHRAAAPMRTGHEAELIYLDPIRGRKDTA